MPNKEELENLMKIKGEVKGVVFQTDKDYILKKEGEEGLEKLRAKEKELGIQLPYEKAKAMERYPVGLRAVSLLIMKDTFGWSDQDLRKMGANAVKVSFMVKMLMKFFISVEKFVEKIPLYWEKHYNVGKLEVIKFDQENREVVLRQTGFEIHPILYTYLEGYYEQMFRFVERNVIGKFREATFKGQPCHEFVIKW